MNICWVKWVLQVVFWNEHPWEGTVWNQVVVWDILKEELKSLTGMFEGTIWLHPVLLPHVVWDVGGNGKINRVQGKLPRASQLLDLLITDSSGAQVPRYSWIIQTEQCRIGLCSQWVTGKQALHMEFKHNWKAHAQEEQHSTWWGHGTPGTETEPTGPWHTQRQSQPAPYDPTATPGTKAVQQALGLPVHIISFRAAGWTFPPGIPHLPTA